MLKGTLEPGKKLLMQKPVKVKVKKAENIWLMKKQPRVMSVVIKEKIPTTKKLRNDIVYFAYFHKRCLNILYISYYTFEMFWC